MDWSGIAAKACSSDGVTESEARAALDCTDADLLSLMDAAYRVRRKFFGKRVKLNFLLNAKSGLCPEDCSYCSQSKLSKADIDKYPLMKGEDILAAAGRAVESGAKRLCMVNSGRGPTDGEVDQVAVSVRQVREKYPQLQICVCLGLLDPSQAEQLKSAGVDAYNHNLNTSEKHYEEICSTHTFKDRVDTVRAAQKAGLSSCSGCLLGMGESDDEIVSLAFEFRKMKVDSIPINFLMPIPGTPLENQNKLTPQKCLKILAMFRLVNPDSEIRVAGGREYHLRWLQPLALYAANSIFVGDYLTTKGQKPADDLAMIRDLGFEIEGHPELTAAGAESLPDTAFSLELK